ncbi:MAG: hypothetical protein ACPG4T_10905 [Nannocystaceae bacterium]
MRLVLESYNLHAAERLLCVEGLNEAGSIVDAAKLLGITRHALKRRIIKHNIPWPPARKASAAPVIVTPQVQPAQVVNAMPHQPIAIAAD